MAHVDNSISQVQNLADKLRHQERWAEAFNCYAKIDNQLQWSVETKHHMAICLFALRRYQDALTYCDAALILKPLWQAQLLKAKCLRSLEHHAEAQSVLQRMVLSETNAESSISASEAFARIDLAELALNYDCDAHACRELVKPILNDERFAEKAQLSDLIARLYARSETAEELTYAFIAYAQRFIQQKPDILEKPSHGLSNRPKQGLFSGYSNKSIKGYRAHDVIDLDDLINRCAKVLSKKKLKIGILSPLLNASPVYFLTYKIWQRVAQNHDVILLDRSVKNDWASESFKDIAHEYVDTSVMSVPVLANTLNDIKLDVLFEMGGWSDPDGLKAVSVQPAIFQFKWVGGQSVTTGLSCFDGYISDQYQTPHDEKIKTHHLYAEDLIHLSSGYIDYFPPSYVPYLDKSEGGSYGIIGNPVKIPLDFNYRLQKIIDKHRLSIHKLIFIDRHFANKNIQIRIDNALAKRDFLVKFSFPNTHESFLRELSLLSGVFDLGDYSAGLTAAEIIALDIPLFIFNSGLLFCDRHSLSHIKFNSYLN